MDDRTPDMAALVRIAVAQLRREHDATLLTPRDVADRLQVSTRTVQRLVASGQLRAMYVGRLPRFTEREVAAYLAAAYRQR